MRSASTADRERFTAHLGQGAQGVQAARAEAETEFPVGAHVADVQKQYSHGHNSHRLISGIKRLFGMLIALATTCGGILMIAMMVGQADSAAVPTMSRANAVAENFINLPKTISLTGNPSLLSQQAEANPMMVSTIHPTRSTLGIHWDTCARYTLLPTTDSFISYDQSSTQYNIIGAVGNTTTTSGYST